MWNNISSKIKQWLVSAKEWFAIVKKWVILRKDWVIIGVAGVLAIALVVGVILVIVDKTSGDDPVQDTTTGIQMEATDQTYDTGEETVSQSGAEDTTAASMSEETTAPEETTEGTKPVEKDPLQDGNGSAGTGFTDQAPQGPSTSVTPSTPEIPDETAPPPTETMAPEKPVQEYTYKEYMALASSEKTKFFYAFPSLGDFNRWYNAAKKAYDEEKLVIGDSNIDLDELLNP